MNISNFNIPIYDPENIYIKIGICKLFQDTETMCLHLYNNKNQELGHIDIRDILNQIASMV